MDKTWKCHRDEIPKKLGMWNAVNPTSEKPKIGRGAKRYEYQVSIGHENVDKWLSLTEHGLLRVNALKLYSLEITSL